MKFAQKNIYLVMNLDFDKPSARMIEMAKEANVDLKDKRMLQEFKSVQLKNIDEIKNLKVGQLAKPANLQL